MLSGKARVEFTLLVALLGVGVALRLAELAFLALPIAVHLVGAYAWAEWDRRPQLSAHRTLSARRIWEGETVEIEIAIENRGARVELVHAADRLPSGLSLVAGTVEEVRELASGEALHLRYTVQARRGLYPLPTVGVEAEDLLGYVTRREELPCSSPLVVIPRLEALSALSISPRRTLPQSGTARSRRGGAGIEFFGTREYRPGDELRRIHWKASARLDQLVVTEFEEERAADVAVVLDVRDRAYRGQGGTDLLDHGARAAASLCQAFLAHGHRVGLLLYGAYLDWVYPGFGRRHGERLLRELARAKLGSSEVFAEIARLPTRLLRAGSQIALVSPLLPGDEEDLGALACRGYNVLALVVDAATADEPSLGTGPEVELARRILRLERWALIGRLYAAHVTPVVWDVRYPLAPQVQAAGRRRPR